MLLKRETLEGIASGEITLAFRRWKRPTVKAGGRLRTRIGELARTIHEHARHKPQTAGFAGLSAPAGTLRTPASSAT